VFALPLAALIAAQLPLESGDGLRATLPLAGRTLIEFQARTAHAAGAGRIILLVETIPAALAQAVDRLRRDGVMIEVARSAADAADRFHVDDRILLIADGCFVEQQLVDRLVTCSASALLIVPDMAEYGLFERIDAEARWAGYALIEAGGLQETVRQLGDWDLTSTVLRRSVQAGAVRIAALARAGEEDTGIPPIIAVDAMSLRAVDSLLMRQPVDAEGDWAGRHIHRLIAAPLLAPLVNRKIEPLAVAAGSVATAIMAAIFAIFGFFWVAAVLLPISAAVFSVARRMARIWWAEVAYARTLLAVRQTAGLVVLAALSRELVETDGWGWWGVAAMIPLGLMALAALRPIASAVGVIAWPSWLPGGDGLVWLMPCVAILLGWAGALAALASYVFVAFGWQFASTRKRAISGIASSS
jgi:hypothetical protein